MIIDIDLIYRFGIKAGRIAGTLTLKLVGDALLGGVYRMIAGNTIAANKD